MMPEAPITNAWKLDEVAMVGHKMLRMSECGDYRVCFRKCNDICIVWVPRRKVRCHMSLDESN
jgi:hypothetical protein